MSEQTNQEDATQDDAHKSQQGLNPRAASFNQGAANGFGPVNATGQQQVAGFRPPTGPRAWQARQARHARQARFAAQARYRAHRGGRTVGATATPQTRQQAPAAPNMAEFLARVPPYPSAMIYGFTPQGGYSNTYTVAAHPQMAVYDTYNQHEHEQGKL